MAVFVRSHAWLQPVLSLAAFFLVSGIGMWLAQLILGPDPGMLQKALAVGMLLYSYLYGGIAAMLTGAMLDGAGTVDAASDRPGQS